MDSTTTVSVSTKSAFTVDQDGHSQKETFVSKTHNYIQSNNPAITTTSMWIKNETSFGHFIQNQNNIANDPIVYLKEENSSLRGKIFDLAIGGPLAGISDTISGVFSVVEFFIRALGNTIRGLAQTTVSKGKDLTHLKKAWSQIKTGFDRIKSVVKNALRTIPVIGVFISYGAKFIDAAICTKMNSAAEAIKGRFEQQQESEDN